MSAKKILWAFVLLSDFTRSAAGMCRLLERDSADHILARRLCALLHPRLRTKRLAVRMAAGRDLEGGWQAAAGSQAVVTKPGDENRVRGENRRWATEKVTKCSRARMKRRRPISQFRVPKARLAQPRQRRSSWLVSFRPTD